MPPEEAPEPLHPEQFDRNMDVGGATTQPLTWHSPKEPPFHLAGFAWFARDGAYRRLPVHPAHPIRPEVNGLANCTAGGQVRFQTDSTRLHVRTALTGPGTMWHMPATGQCGFDCYIGPPARQGYCGTARFEQTASAYESMLFENLPREMRNVTVNMPLYQGVEELSLGLDPDARILPPPTYAREGRCVVYGTSITQGGCASRPGMLPTNILSRRLNVEFINLGLSGNGRGEPELARLVAEIENPLAYVLDYEGNAGGIEQLRETLPEFIRILRAGHPTTPIVVLSCTRWAGEVFSEKTKAERAVRRTFQRETVEALREAGDAPIEFADGSKFYGEDSADECTVDGVHATDLGFLRIADAWTPILGRVLLG